MQQQKPDSRMPEFVVIGAQKSATTWLFECLDEHPEIFVPAGKELHFFCRSEDCRFSTEDNGLEWYLSQFGSGSHGKIKGELTTDYMYFDYVLDCLHKLNKDFKIVILLRDPVYRAYSAYWMWKRHNAKLMNFGDMIRGEGNSLLGRGLYFRQINPYYDRFGPEKIRTYIYEKIVKNPEEFAESIYEFIGVNSGFRPRCLRKQVAETKIYPGQYGRIMYKVVSPFLNSKLVLPIWRLIRRRTNLKEWVLQRLSERASIKYPPMGEDDRRFLITTFAAENRKLYDLLGYEIPEWENLRNDT